ncbi:MAG TPA: hypothetical protein VFV10_01095 [Gammaproteobacteria bacterium]|nr:hypothetical protein [Gammaproteobacteria bacterium]
MPHVIEFAASGRAKCRGCDKKIAKGELRFGERLPNAFGEGEATLWFHLRCAAYKRPETFLEALAAGDEAAAVAAVPDKDELRACAELGAAHRRLPRVARADRAPTGRARCRHCRELIEKGQWRIGLEFFEEYRFEPSGFVHARCAHEYLGTTQIADRLRHFNPDLPDEELDALVAAMASAPGAAPQAGAG